MFARKNQPGAGLARPAEGGWTVSIEVALYHRTDYRYDRLVALGPQVVRLRPAPHSRTPIRSYSLTIEPTPHFVNWQQDPQGNYLARVVFPDRTDHLTVTVDLVADMAVVNPFDFFLEPGAEIFPFAYDPALASEFAPFRQTLPPGPLLRHTVAQIDRAPTTTIDFLVAINSKLQRDIRYIVRLEPGIQTPEETLKSGEGSCRDTALRLLVRIAAAHLRFAARFASGYLIQLVADQKPLEGPAGSERRLHRPARLVRGVFAGRGLGRPLIRPRACSPGEGLTFCSPARPSRKAPPPRSPARPSTAKR